MFFLYLIKNERILLVCITLFMLYPLHPPISLKPLLQDNKSSKIIMVVQSNSKPQPHIDSKRIIQTIEQMQSLFPLPLFPPKTFPKKFMFLILLFLINPRFTYCPDDFNM